jgi:RND family efflux transporter MFP subunit
MKTRSFLAGAGVVALAAAAVYLEGGDKLVAKLRQSHAEPARRADTIDVTAPAVSAAKVVTAHFVETALVTGSLVAREEVLVAPEIEGLRVQTLMVDEGARVRKGDVLAVLTQDTLDAQIAQSDASLARASAAIAKALSQIAQSQAKLAEAKAAFERAKPLRQSGNMADSLFDQREAAAKSAEAQVVTDGNALQVAEAERRQVEAQRRELDWRRERTEVRAPVDGLVSRRSARLGGIATAVGEAMFRIVAGGEVELDAEVTDMRLGQVRVGQKAVVEAAGVGEVEGAVRLVSPEVDKATRLGRVRIFLGNREGLRIGAFARARIETASGDGLAVPASALLYSADGASVLVVQDGKVTSRKVELGLSAQGLTEVRKGLSEGDLVVAKAGTFLRDGDLVRPVLPAAKVSSGDSRSPAKLGSATP